MMTIMIQNGGSKFRRGAIVVVTLILASGLRMYGLGHESFWVDEVHQFRVSSQTISDIVKNYRQDTPHETHDQAPLSMLITHFFLAEKHPEFFARLPSVIFGVFGILALFLFSRQLLPFSTSILASFLLALCPLAIWYSQEARWYSQWSFGTTIAYLALLKAVEQPRKGSAWLAYGLAALANLYTFVYSVFVLLAQGISLIWREIAGDKKWSSVGIFSGINFAVFAASIPVIMMILQRAEEDQFYSGTARASSLFEIPYTFLTFATGFTVGPSLGELHSNPGLAGILSEYPALFVVGLVFVPIFLAGLLDIVRRPPLASWILPWLVVPPFAVFLTSLAADELTYQVRYTFASIPAFVVVLAVGLSSFGVVLRRFALGAMLALWVYSLVNYYWVEKYDKADARGATAYLRSVGGDRIQLVAVGQIEYAMYYYAGRPPFEVIRDCGTEDGMDGEADLGTTLWLMSGRDWNHDVERCLPELNLTHEIADRTAFTGIELWRLEPRTERQQ